MAALNHFIAVFVLCALGCTIVVADSCTTVLYGQTTLNHRPLAPVYLVPGIKMQEVIIHAGCPAVGVLVTVCDDVAPNVYVKSTRQAVIERLGSLIYPGYVKVVAYCPFGKESHDETPKLHITYKQQEDEE